MNKGKTKREHRTKRTKFRSKRVKDDFSLQSEKNCNLKSNCNDTTMLSQNKDIDIKNNLPGTIAKEIVPTENVQVYVIKNRC